MTITIHMINKIREGLQKKNCLILKKNKSELHQELSSRLL
jgi:hypothetical protein